MSWITFIGGFFISGDSVEKLSEKLIKKYGLNESGKDDLKQILLKRQIMSLIISFDESKYCGDCVNSKWEGGCESSINGPAEPGYYYCGLSDERKKQLEDCGDSVECFEMGDCDAGMCLDFEEKDLKEELEKLMNSSSWSLEENALILREANILRLKRRIELEEEAMV